MLPEQATFERMPARLGWWPVPLSQRAMIPSEASPAMKPGIRSTGWPWPSVTPLPRKTGFLREGRQLESHAGFAPERGSLEALGHRACPDSRGQFLTRRCQARVG